MPDQPRVIELIGPPGSGKSTLAHFLEREFGREKGVLMCAHTAKVNRTAESIAKQSVFLASAYRAVCRIPSASFVLSEQLKPAAAWEDLADEPAGLTPLLAWIRREAPNFNGEEAHIARRVGLFHRACLDMAYIQAGRSAPRNVVFDESITQSVISLALHHPDPDLFLTRYLDLRVSKGGSSLTMVFLELPEKENIHRLSRRSEPLHDHVDNIKKYRGLIEFLAGIAGDTPIPFVTHTSGRSEGDVVKWMRRYGLGE